MSMIGHGLAAAFMWASGLSAPAEIRGRASWYGESYRGHPMTNGQPFDPEAMTCAAQQWPLGSLLRVTALTTGRGAIVEVTDRGPAQWTGCIVDLSSRAFRRICDPQKGRTQVRIEVLRVGPEQEGNGLKKET